HLSPARLGRVASACLGFADPRRVLRPARDGADPRVGPAGGPPRRPRLHGTRWLPAPGARTVRSPPLPPLPRARPAPHRPHGRLLGVVVLLRPLRPATRGRRAVRPRRARLLARPPRCRSVHRRHRARGAPPPLRALLHQGPPRPRIPAPRRAVPAPAHPG